jgi:hypothetical protein
MQNNCPIKGVSLVEIVIREKLGCTLVPVIIYHRRMYESQIFNEKLLVAVVINDDNGFLVKFANAGITFFPIEIG